MTKNSQIDVDEINLIELMCIIWKGKWKIAVVIVISFLAMQGYHLMMSKNFSAITEIRPLNSHKKNEFLAFNLSIISADAESAENDTPGKITKITSLRLLNLYIEIINDKLVFEDAIRKFNLLDASQYNNDQEYNEAIIKLASSVKILSPLIDKEKEGNSEISYHTINFTYDDVEKWKNVLIYVDELANQLVKKNLIDEYNNSLLFLKKKQEYQLEDILIKFDNYLIDYEREISDRISYLKEQSEIAKKLGIEKNTIEVQTFGSQNAFLSNVKTASPFYLRGYEAIDKEIELIESRDNKKAFIKGLFELEKTKRAIEQDKTIERTKLILQSMLLSDSKEFSATSTNVFSTKFEYKNYKHMLIMAIVIGLIVGIFYVLISSALQSHSVSRKKTN
jgi:LPS O-antigen subunit length determinant protein (WzzB/FepE family)